MDQHKTIWLQPWCQACADTEDRMWCQDNVWAEGCEECGTMPVKYVLAPDQPARKEPDDDWEARLPPPPLNPRTEPK
jgi:hypothetical protein